MNPLNPNTHFSWCLFRVQRPERSEDMKRISMLLAATFTLSLFTTSCATNSSDPSKTANTASAMPLTPAKDEDKQWTMANKDYSSTRYSTLNTINTDTV